MQPNMQKYQLTEDEMTALLNREKYSVIATVGQDGMPYAVPVNYIYLDGKIYFHGRKTGEKVDNITADPRCCFTVVTTGGFEYTGEWACNTTTVYESVVIRGKVRVVEDENEKMRILRATVDILTPERKSDPINPKSVMPTSIFEITIESMTGKYHRPMEGHKIVK